MVEFRPNFELPEMVGDSPQFHRLLDDIARAAELDLPVLVRGERGTGKELVAWVLAAAGHWTTSPAKLPPGRQWSMAVRRSEHTSLTKIPLSAP